MEAPSLLVVRELGDRDDPYWFAATGSGEAPLLEAGEPVLWQGFAQVRQKGPTTWELEGMWIAVTDRRLVYLTTTFDKGGGYSGGFGAVTLVAAATLNAISKHQARKRSAGKVAIGHVRHEWVNELSVIRRKVFIGGPDVAVVLLVRTGGQPQVLELKGPGTREEFGAWLASQIARHRLATDGTLGGPERALLTSQANGSGRPMPEYGDGSTSWVFPGGLTGRQYLVHDQRAGPGAPSAFASPFVGSGDRTSVASPAASTLARGDGSSCPRCGEPASPGQRFCTGCGTSLATS